MEGAEYCFFHSPDEKVAEKRKQAVREGGHHGRRRAVLEPVRVRNLDELAQLLEITINDVRSCRVNTNQANAIGYLASTLARVFEARDLDVKIQAIEVVLKRRGEIDGKEDSSNARRTLWRRA
jgi:hypothetical protein